MAGRPTRWRDPHRPPTVGPGVRLYQRKRPPLWRAVAVSVGEVLDGLATHAVVSVDTKTITAAAADTAAYCGITAITAVVYEAASAGAAGLAVRVSTR